MSNIIYYRGDNRDLDEIKKDSGFQPHNKEHRNRTAKQAYDYIKGLELKKSVDLSRYIISSSKKDSVSCSRIIEGASYGEYKYKINLPSKDIKYFLYKDGKELGKAISYEQTLLKSVSDICYYILSSDTIDDSDFLIIGTRTQTQEVTFFTDIPDNWIEIYHISN